MPRKRHRSSAGSTQVATAKSQTDVAAKVRWVIGRNYEGVEPTECNPLVVFPTARAPIMSTAGSSVYNSASRLSIKRGTYGDGATDTRAWPIGDPPRARAGPIH